MRPAVAWPRFQQVTRRAACWSHQHVHGHVSALHSAGACRCLTADTPNQKDVPGMSPRLKPHPKALRLLHTVYAAVQRVSTLLRDNRHYRRQAMQAQLAALHAAAAGAGPLPSQQAEGAAAAAAAVAPAVQLMQQPAALGLPPGRSEAAAAGELVPGGGGGSRSSEQDVLQLQGALAAAEQHLAVLSDENERLMELSNSLRAENEQLKRSLQVGLQYMLATAHMCK